MVSFPEISFTGIYVHAIDDYFISGVSDELSDENIDHAIIIRFNGGLWYYQTLEYSVVGMYAFESGSHVRLLCLTPNGLIITLRFPGYSIMPIDESDEGPSDLVTLRVMKKIGRHLYAAGMGRRVYRQEHGGGWTAIDDGAFVPRDLRKKAVGFNDIAGPSDNEMYGVGYKGEIWMRRNSSWFEAGSPTNVTLTCVSYGTDQRVYIGGMNGLILSGRNSAWGVLTQAKTKEDFWGCICFKGEMYFSGYEGIYAFSFGHSELNMRRVSLGLDKDVTTAYVHSNDDIIVSVGDKNICCSADGVIWTEVIIPYDRFQRIE